MNLKLAEIADLQSGYHFPEGVSFDPESKYRVIQPKDISRTGEVGRSEQPAHTPKQPQQSHIIKERDILFISRMNPRAAFVSHPLPNTIATSHFFIIRTLGKTVVPGYLAWFLNQKPTQATLRKVGQGTSIINVTKKDLLNLDVNVPAIELQTKIMKLDLLSRSYRATHDQLQTTVDKMIEILTTQALQKSEQGVQT